MSGSNSSTDKAQDRVDLYRDWYAEFNEYAATINPDVKVLHNANGNDMRQLVINRKRPAAPH